MGNINKSPIVLVISHWVIISSECLRNIRIYSSMEYTFFVVKSIS